MSKSKKRKKQRFQEIKKYSLLVICLIQTISIFLLVSYIISINNGTEKKIENAKTYKYDNFVFLGDSITDWYPFEEFYSPDVPIINSGFAGYTSEDLLKNMDETVYKYNPTKVFIQVGTNDLNRDNHDIDKVYKNIVKIIKNIKSNRPSTKVYLESIYPINTSNDERIDKVCVGIRENVEIVELNKKLKDFCDKNDVVYINLYDKLSDAGGDLRLDYTKEGLHLSDKGYLAVSNELKKYIKEN